MSTQVQHRRGTALEHTTFMGVLGELTVDTETGQLRVHNGTVLGGAPIDTAVNPRWKNARGTGLIDDRAAIAAADLQAGDAGVIFTVGTYLVSSNLDINGPVEFRPGAILKPANGVTITFNGAVTAPLRKCFDTSLGGTVAFRGVAVEVFPQWWGAVGNSAGNQALPFQECIEAAELGRCIMTIPDPGNAQYYRFTERIVVTHALHIRAKTNVFLFGVSAAIGDGVPLLDIDGTVLPNLEDVLIENITLMSDAYTCDLMHITRVAASTFRNIRLRRGKHQIVYGDFLDATGRTYSNHFENVTTVESPSGDALRCAPNGGGHYFTECSFGGSYGVDWVGSAVTFADTVVFDKCNFEHAGNGVVIAPLTDLIGLKFSACRWEKNTALALSVFPQGAAAVYGFECTQSFFETDNAGNALVMSGLVRGYSIKRNVFKDFTPGAVRWNGTGSYGEVANNGLIECPITDGYRLEYNEVYNNFLISGAGDSGPTKNFVPSLVPTYLATNGTLSRTFDADTATVAQLADVVATLLADLRAQGRII